MCFELLYFADDPLLKGEQISCKPLANCTELLQFVDQDPDNIFALTPCTSAEYEEEPESFVCMEPGFKSRFDHLETELSDESCNCVQLRNCTHLMANFVQVQDWTGLSQIDICGFDGIMPKYCCKPDELPDQDPDEFTTEGFSCPWPKAICQIRGG